TFGIAFVSSGHVALRIRGLAVAWLVLVYTYARYAEWWGGRVFGPRFLDDLAPAVIAAIAWGISPGLLTPAWSRVAFAVAPGWSLLLFNAAALVFDPSGWDLNINFDQSRLYSWTDTQWMSVLGAMASPDPRMVTAVLLSALIVALFVRLELRPSSS